MKIQFDSIINLINNSNTYIFRYFNISTSVIDINVLQLDLKGFSKISFEIVSIINLFYLVFYFIFYFFFFFFSLTNST